MDLSKTLQRLRWAWRAVKFGPTVFYETLGGLKSASGVQVDPMTALKLSALLGALRVLASALSTVPLKVFRRDGDVQRESPEHPVYRLVHDAANVRTTAVEWRFEQVVHMIIYGRSFSQIVMNGKGEVMGFWPLHPTRVRIVDETEEKWNYEFTRANGEKKTYPFDEILYIPLLIEGRSLFEHASDVLGLGISADQFAARYFSAGGTQQQVMLTDQVVPPEKKKEIVNLWHEWQRAGRVPFLDAGTEVRELTAKPADVQLLEVRRFVIEEIGRILGVPPHLNGDLQRATNNNIEHQGIDFVTHTVRPLAVRIEQRMNLHLFGPREGSRVFVEHNLDGLQRGDFKSRADGTAAMVASALQTPNEARKLFNMPALPGGDQLYIQGAMVPLEMAGQHLQSQGGDNAGQA